MSKETAIQNLQSLINAAIEKGLFSDAAAVIQMQASLEYLQTLSGRGDANGKHDPAKTLRELKNVPNE